MKRILLAMLLLIVAMSLMATAHTVSTVTTNWVEGLALYSCTTAFTDSTTEQIAYIDTAAFDGRSLCGKLIIVNSTITTTVTQGGADPSVAKLMPVIYASVDGTTYRLAENLVYARSAALTTGTSTQFVVDLRGFYAPFIKIYYVGVATAGVTAGTGAVYGGKVVTLIAVKTNQQQ